MRLLASPKPCLAISSLPRDPWIECAYQQEETNLKHHITTRLFHLTTCVKNCNPAWTTTRMRLLPLLLWFQCSASSDSLFAFPLLLVQPFFCFPVWMLVHIGRPLLLHQSRVETVWKVRQMPRQVRSPWRFLTQYLHSNVQEIMSPVPSLMLGFSYILKYWYYLMKSNSDSVQIYFRFNSDPIQTQFRFNSDLIKMMHILLNKTSFC